MTKCNRKSYSEAKKLADGLVSKVTDKRERDYLRNNIASSAYPDDLAYAYLLLSDYKNQLSTQAYNELTSLLLFDERCCFLVEGVTPIAMAKAIINCLNNGVEITAQRLDKIKEAKLPQVFVEGLHSLSQLGLLGENAGLEQCLYEKCFQAENIEDLEEIRHNLHTLQGNLSKDNNYQIIASGVRPGIVEGLIISPVYAQRRLVDCLYKSIEAERSSEHVNHFYQASVIFNQLGSEDNKKEAYDYFFKHPNPGILLASINNTPPNMVLTRFKEYHILCSNTLKTVLDRVRNEKLEAYRQQSAFSFWGHIHVFQRITDTEKNNQLLQALNTFCNNWENQANISLDQMKQSFMEVVKEMAINTHRMRSNYYGNTKTLAGFFTKVLIERATNETYYELTGLLNSLSDIKSKAKTNQVPQDPKEFKETISLIPGAQ